MDLLPRMEVGHDHALEEVVRLEDQGDNDTNNHTHDFDEVISSIDDPRRMRLQQEEIDNALVIKDAVAMLPELDSVSDFMCTQLALIDGDNVEHSMQRLHQLQ